MRRVVCTIALMLVSSCDAPDTRCLKHKYYCASGESRETYLQSIDDNELIKLASLDYRTSIPPSSKMVSEMERRGEIRSRVMLFDYARGSVDEVMIDDMTRIFSENWPVCSRWLQGAPAQSKGNLTKSCGRIFEDYGDSRTTVTVATKH